MPARVGGHTPVGIEGHPELDAQWDHISLSLQLFAAAPSDREGLEEQPVAGQAEQLDNDALSGALALQQVERLVVEDEPHRRLLSGCPTAKTLQYEYRLRQPGRAIGRMRSSLRRGSGSSA